MLAKAFMAAPFYDLLAERREGFLAAINHLDQASVPGIPDHQRGLILETGCIRNLENWDGDGQSTLVWDYIANLDLSLDVITVDIDPANIALVKANTTKVVTFCEDSIPFLDSLPEETLARVKLLYLDSLDWSQGVQGFESAFHHFCELAAVWAHLPSGCMVMVDDRLGPIEGKHVLIEQFFRRLKQVPVYIGYQIAWIKP